MVAKVLFSVLLLVLMIAMLQMFFVLLSVYPQVAFGVVALVACASVYYDYCVGGER